jgi:hypothetical protein
MQVQVVRAATRHLALSEARRRLGPDPLVLAVRRQARADGSGFEWEAVVARDTPSAEGAPVKTSASFSELDALKLDLATVQAGLPKDTSTHDLLLLARRLTQLEHGLLEGVLASKKLEAHWLPLLERLEHSGYPRAEALAILQRVEAAGGPGRRAQGRTGAASPAPPSGLGGHRRGCPGRRAGAAQVGGLRGRIRRGQDDLGRQVGR